MWKNVFSTAEVDGVFFFLRIECSPNATHKPLAYGLVSAICIILNDGWAVNIMGQFQLDYMHAYPFL